MRHTDIQLSQTLIDRIRGRKYLDDQWVQYGIRSAQANEYIKDNLDIVKNEARSAGRCFTIGDIAFARKDGLKLTEDDIAAVKDIDRGQANSFSVSDDGCVINHHWECDSGD